MGFDLYAVSPRTTTEAHLYFRNNVWYWRPLWGYCHQLHLITYEQFQCGQYNDGYKICKQQAEMMGVRLLHCIEQGHAQKYADEYHRKQEASPKEPCFTCKGTGMIEDKECHTCSGKGLRENWAMSYPFDVKNVEEFAKFCMNSGGFEIW